MKWEKGRGGGSEWGKSLAGWANESEAAKSEIWSSSCAAEMVFHGRHMSSVLTFSNYSCTSALPMRNGL